MAEAEWLDSVAADERDTAAQLQQLSTAHSILHDLKIEGVQGNIDHLVIGPGGAFVVVTRRFGESLSVNGETLLVGERSLQAELDGITNVASRLAQQLGTAVVPVIDGLPTWVAVTVREPAVTRLTPLVNTWTPASPPPARKR